jgi:hypothetical protein
VQHGQQRGAACLLLRPHSSSECGLQAVCGCVEGWGLAL